MDQPVTMKTLVIALVLASVISAAAAIAVSSAMSHRGPRGVAGVPGPPGEEGPKGTAGAEGEGTKKLCEAIGNAYSNAAPGSAVETAMDELKNEGC